MSQLLFRRVARFEQRANAHLKRRQQDETDRSERIRGFAFRVVGSLSCLILYGRPKIDESLFKAWERCCESAAWQACREKHGGFDEYGREDGTPFEHLGAIYIAKYFRRYFLPDLPGAHEVEKLSRIFKGAPPWLLWFAHGDVHARILGVELPDLSAVTRFARGEPRLNYLPPGPFELHPLPDGVYDRFTPRRKD